MLCASPARTGKPDTPEDAPTLNPWFKTKITTVQAGVRPPLIQLNGNSPATGV